MIIKRGWLLKQQRQIYIYPIITPLQRYGNEVEHHGENFWNKNDCINAENVGRIIYNRKLCRTISFVFLFMRYLCKLK